jgi:hypothetical protein
VFLTRVWGLCCARVHQRQEGGDGWWEGRLGDETGIFPENYVEVCVPRPLAHGPTGTRTLTHTVYVCTCAYVCT